MHLNVWIYKLIMVLCLLIVTAFAAKKSHLSVTSITNLASVIAYP